MVNHPAIGVPGYPHGLGNMAHIHSSPSPENIHITPNLRAIAAQRIRGQEDTEGRDVGHFIRRRPGPEIWSGSTVKNGGLTMV